MSSASSSSSPRAVEAIKLCGTASTCLSLFFLIAAMFTNQMLVGSFTAQICLTEAICNDQNVMISTSIWSASALSATGSMQSGASYGDASVDYDELNTANACNPDTKIFTEWALPNGFCTSSLQFTIPAALSAVRGVSITALCVAPFVVCAAWADTVQRGIIYVCTCTVLVILCATTLGEFTNWNYVQTLRSQGSPLPMWIRFPNGTAILDVTPNVTASYGATFVLQCLAMALISVSWFISIFGLILLFHQHPDGLHDFFGREQSKGHYGML